MKKRIRRPWAEEDRRLLRRNFQSSFTSKCPPSKNDVMLQGKKCEGIQKLITERGWQSVKYYVWNLVQQHIKTANLFMDAAESYVSE